MTGSIKLLVKDIFFFKDGRTVFVGPVEGDTAYIRPGDFEIWVNGKEQGKIHVEGEMINCRSDLSKQQDLRSVSTRDATGLSQEIVANGTCVLRSAN